MEAAGTWMHAHGRAARRVNSYVPYVPFPEGGNLRADSDVGAITYHSVARNPSNHQGTPQV
ncbi:hypothetical protein NPIL_289981, partial [Nephila pilipes]